MIQVKTEPPKPPAPLLAALDKCTLKYSTPASLYHIIDYDIQGYCGVFGDGSNGSYEWFIWREGNLEHSNAGYGSPESALRDVLNRVHA